VRHLQEIREPAADHLLQLDRRRAEGPHADVLVDRGRPRLDDRRRGQRASGDVAEAAAAGAAREAAGRPLLELAEDVLERDPTLGQGLLETGADRLAVERHPRLRRRLERGAEALGEIGDRGVDVGADLHGPTSIIVAMDVLFLARHGESEYSARGLMNGEPRTAVRLTERGREEARVLGERLRDERLDLCVTSEFGRTIETADIALAGRGVPRLVLRELNDVRVGEFEGRTLAEYRKWAHARDPLAVPPGGDESRAATVARYVRGFERILARAEGAILVVAHGLPIRYLLNAARGLGPVPVLEQIEHATPYRLSREELDAAVARLRAWTLSPSWATSASP
jgi:broad specificity phosphatase PhoE